MLTGSLRHGRKHREAMKRQVRPPFRCTRAQFQEAWDHARTKVPDWADALRYAVQAPSFWDRAGLTVKVELQ